MVQHDCDSAAAHVLGRAMTGVLLTAAVLLEGQCLNACGKYQGVKTIVVDAGQDEQRGSLNCHIVKSI